MFTAPGADSATVYAVYDANGTYTLTTALQCYGNIAGIVSDSATGLPIGGATVEFFAALPGGGWASTPVATLIAPDGAYTSPQLPTGAYAVRATAAGYTAAYFGGSAPTAVAVSRAVTTAGDRRPAGSAAGRQFGSISGRVVSGATETPMGGAYVYLYKQNADGTWPADEPWLGQPDQDGVRRHARQLHVRRHPARQLARAGSSPCTPAASGGSTSRRSISQHRSR